MTEPRAFEAEEGLTHRPEFPQQPLILEDRLQRIEGRLAKLEGGGGSDPREEAKPQ